jgi:hypothetical protein
MLKSRLQELQVRPARLHQAISDRIEPKLPVFECEGVVTETDRTSGVIIMRTLQSHLAPHRHTQNNHCNVRRNGGAESLSMLEIQEMTRPAQRFVNDRQVDVLGLQEIIRSERTREKSRLCVTRAAALIANALAA